MRKHSTVTLVLKQPRFTGSFTVAHFEVMCFGSRKKQPLFWRSSRLH